MAATQPDPENTAKFHLAKGLGRGRGPPPTSKRPSWSPEAKRPQGEARGLSCDTNRGRLQRCRVEKGLMRCVRIPRESAQSVMLTQRILSDAYANEAVTDG